MKVATLFKPDYARYDGLRPIQVHLLRVSYVLVLVLVGHRSWSALVGHQGDWDPYLAVALAMWASSSLLSLLGVLQPIKMLPLVLFEVGYKIIWLGFVAWPLWSSNRLAGPAEDLTYAFVWVLIPILLIPWPYVVRSYVFSRRRPRAVTYG